VFIAEDYTKWNNGIFKNKDILLKENRKRGMKMQISKRISNVKYFSVKNILHSCVKKSRSASNCWGIYYLFIVNRHLKL
jgi:hypothetical protein